MIISRQHALLGIDRQSCQQTEQAGRGQFEQTSILGRSIGAFICMWFVV
jgi:hypothetical protein